MIAVRVYRLSGCKEEKLCWIVRSSAPKKKKEEEEVGRSWCPSCEVQEQLASGPISNIDAAAAVAVQPPRSVRLSRTTVLVNATAVSFM